MTGVSLLATLNAALDATETTPADQTAVHLALLYASQIDENEARASELGPKLLTALDALCMTPRARNAIKGASGAAILDSPLDQLKARRAARIADPAAVDAPAS